MNKKLLRGSSFVCALLLAAPCAAQISLYMEKLVLKAYSENGCLSIARNAMEFESFVNLRSDGISVSGEKDGAYVAVTCVARDRWPTMALVVSSTPEFERAKRVGHSLAVRMAPMCAGSAC